MSLTLLPALVGFNLPGDGVAQQRGTIELMPTIGAAFYLNEVIDPAVVDEQPVRSTLEDAFAFGFSLGLNFTETIGFDAGFLYIPTELASSTAGVSAGLEANEYIVGGTFRFAHPWPRPLVVRIRRRIRASGRARA